MQNLIETFRRIANIKPDNEKALLGSIEKKEYPPRTLLQAQNKTSNKIYFVEKGIARTFYYKEGRDITHWLAIENDFVGSISSFFMRRPSNKIVETVEHCVLWEFEHQKLEDLIALNPEFDKIVRLFAYYGLSLLEERFDNLQFYTAKERFDILLEKQPEILKRVPLGMIASYLGMTQETLSRIRK